VIEEKGKNEATEEDKKRERWKIMKKWKQCL
jgi:hypothetical protein